MITSNLLGTSYRHREESQQCEDHQGETRSVMAGRWLWWLSHVMSHDTGPRPPSRGVMIRQKYWRTMSVKTIKRSLSIYEILMHHIYAIINLITSHCFMMSRHALLCRGWRQFISAIISRCCASDGPGIRHLWTLHYGKLWEAWLNLIWSVSGAILRDLFRGNWTKRLLEASLPSRYTRRPLE